MPQPGYSHRKKHTYGPNSVGGYIGPIAGLEAVKLQNSASFS
jgi:hypothetical protein